MISFHRGFIIRPVFSAIFPLKKVKYAFFSQTQPRPGLNALFLAKSKSDITYYSQFSGSAGSVAMPRGRNQLLALLVSH
jgi:hypothetical protein